MIGISMGKRMGNVMSKNKIFFDTGAWIALMDSGDQYYEKAAAFYRSLQPSVQRISSSHVIAETYTWLRYKAGFFHASQYLAVIERARSNHSLILLHDDPNLLSAAEQILRDFPDQKLSYVDALSMAMMRKEKICEIFTFDRHFRLMNFEVLPDPEVR